MKSHAIYLTQTPGRCRWCRCTELEPCANGCGWANREGTLCSECVRLDRAMKNAPGRRELAEFLQEHGFLAGGVRHAQLTRGKACARPGCQRPRAKGRRLCAWHTQAVA